MSTRNIEDTLHNHIHRGTAKHFELVLCVVTELFSLTSNSSNVSSDQRPQVYISTSHLPPQQWRPEFTSATTDSPSPYSAFPPTPASADANNQTVSLHDGSFGCGGASYYHGTSTIPAYSPVLSVPSPIRPKVASDKVRIEAERKRKHPPKFFCDVCSASFTAKHNFQCKCTYYYFFWCG